MEFKNLLSVQIEFLILQKLLLFTITKTQRLFYHFPTSPAKNQQFPPLKNPAALHILLFLSHISFLYLFFQNTPKPLFIRLKKKNNSKTNQKRGGLLCIYTKEMQKTLLYPPPKKTGNTHSIRL